jgi:hypothetical protein
MGAEQADDRELKAILRHLVDEGRIDGPARGIARQVIARGEGTLSERQEWVFNTQVRAEYIDRFCRLCEDPIPLSEVVDSWTNSGLCGMCARILADPPAEQTP